ncbi:MAG: SMC-Scp complex subunit ScpB [Pirellulales bacterium]
MKYHLPQSRSPFELGAQRSGATNSRFGDGNQENSRKFLHLICRIKRRRVHRSRSDPKYRNHRMQRLEAVLFLTREPLTSRKLAQLANLADGTEARTLIRSLNRLFDAAHRAFRIEEVAGGFQLMTRAKFSDWIRRLGGDDNPLRFSSPAMETLAVVAYRQPVMRANVEAIRGVNCGEMLRQLMQHDLVRISGRSEELGRPYLYGTTKHFLRSYGLKTLDDLPRSEDFSQPVVTETQETTTTEELVTEENPVSTTAVLEQPLSNVEEERENEMLETATIDAQAPPIEDEENEYYEEADREGEEDEFEEGFDGEWDDNADDKDDTKADDDKEADDDDDDDDPEWEEVEDDDDDDDDKEEDEPVGIEEDLDLDEDEDEEEYDGDDFEEEDDDWDEDEDEEDDD